MVQLPLFIRIFFALTVFVTLFLLYKASGSVKKIMTIAAVWLLVQLVVSMSGFYTVTDVMPPRFALLIIPPVLLIVSLFLTQKGRVFVDSFDVKTLVLLHGLRIPVELTLYGLFLHQAVPEVMTFEGRNFDILAGVTAPFIYYFGYVKPVLKRNVLIAWNIGCLLLLANIVVTAFLSAPFPIQQFGLEQPNIAPLYFPFVWLPCFVVPVVAFAHLTALRELFRRTAVGTGSISQSNN